MLIAYSIITCGCLIAASVSDIRSHKVADLVWYVMAFNTLIFLICGGMASALGAVAETGSATGTVAAAGPVAEAGAGLLLEALLIIFIQERVMSRYYGRADSHAFSCCALYQAVTGCCLEAHIMHMAVSLVLLTAIQAAFGNIEHGLRLKRPVPFIPYITLTFIFQSVMIGRAVEFNRLLYWSI